ncbi:SurA N-terminal domain-containing protein [Agitococcus lubricus]|uniref:Periplasmic chaperone PpiD n=1 Tax=Agitococcus lubricus TaxID=1077255 RepID=A0A2T5J1K6_9GAMM|nr:SurA N-terminal domain-containing protein [Agitococcus lubricus]PTQ90325.1 peptidyl-prolyl cis-trans isomerase D [Agitococcus lubricus]
MQAFRDLIRGWLGKALLVLLLVPFALVGIESYFVGGQAAPVATVNDQEIGQLELDRSVDQQKQRILASLGENPDPSLINTTVLRQQVLKDLVDREVLNQYAVNAGLLVDDAKIAKLLHEAPSFQENGVFSQARYEQVLRNMGEDPATFPAKAKKEIAVSQLTTGLGQSAFVTDKQMNNLLAVMGQKRDIHIATVSAAAYLTQVKATDAEVQKYYQDNAAKYTVEEQVAVDYMELGIEQFINKVIVSNEDLDARYAEKLKDAEKNEQRQASHILIKIGDKVKEADALAKIQEIEKRVKAGEDFGALAKTLSQDEGSATNNGDLGMATRGMFVPEFDKALYALKVGEVSAPVKTQYGYHLIKLLAVQTPPVPSLAELKPALELEIRGIKAEELYIEAVEKMDALAYESADLQEGAKQYGIAIQTSPLFTNKGAATGIMASRKVVQAAFSEEVLKEGKNSQAIALDNKHSVWLRVNKHLPARVKPLEEVKVDARLATELDKASLLAKAQAETIAKAVNSGKTATEIASQYNLQWQEFLATERRAPSPAPELLKTAFRLPMPKANTMTAQTAPSGKDFVVVAVSRVEAGTAATFTDEQKKQAMASLANTVGQQNLKDFIVHLRAQAKIKETAPKAAEQ